MSKEEAKIVSIESLTSQKIGETEEQNKEESDKQLKDSLNGKKQEEDYFGLTPSEEKEESNKKEEESEEDKTLKEEDIKPEEGKTESDILKESLRRKFGKEVETFIQEDSEGNEVEVSLEEIELDFETYHYIIDEKHRLEIEKQTEGKVDISKNSEFAQRILEIDRNGGRYTDLLKAQDDLVNPVSKLDLENEDDQVKAIAYRLQNRGEDEIKRLIGSYKADGKLKEVAKEAVKEINDWFDAELKKREEETLKNKENLKDALKKFKKDLRSQLDQYELKDGIKDKIVEIATAKDDKGVFELDKYYNEKRRAPEEAAKLALYLLDPEEFIGQSSKMEVMKEKKDRAGKLRLRPVSSRAERKPEKKDKSLVSISELESK